MADGGDKILVVDDNRDIRIIMEHRLTKAGYAVTTLDDPRQVEALVAKHEFDLILLDIMMPGMDGYQVLQCLRAKHSSEELPVIMLTASSASHDVVKALSLGANDFATKGEQWDVLLRRVKVHTELSRYKDYFVGPYKVLKKIGSGAMGVVFAAEHSDTGERVAVKVLPRSAAINDIYVKRFLREASLASRVDHPNVVRIRGAGRFEETYYLAMDLIEGNNLMGRFGGHPIEPRLCIAIVRDVAKALQALHAAGVHHRDIKPDNIVLGNDGRVFLTDFGVAMDTGDLDGRLTATGVTVGSPSYASPEQLEGRAEARSDIYSLGATFYWMLTGKVPFLFPDLADIYRSKRSGAPDPRARNPGLPSALASLVMQLMAPVASDRPPDCGSVIARLATVEAALASDPPPATSRSRRSTSS